MNSPQKSFASILAWLAYRCTRAQSAEFRHLCVTHVYHNVRSVAVMTSKNAAVFVSAFYCQLFTLIQTHEHLIIVHCSTTGSFTINQFLSL